MKPYEIDAWQFPETFAFCLGFQDASDFKPWNPRQQYFRLTTISQDSYGEGYRVAMWFDFPGEEYC